LTNKEETETDCCTVAPLMCRRVLLLPGLQFYVGVYVVQMFIILCCVTFALCNIDLLSNKQNKTNTKNYASC